MQAATIIAFCKQIWLQDQNDCSAFVRNVGAKLDIVLHGNANAIVDEIRGGAWTRLANGPAAQQTAAAGKFVIAGLGGDEERQPSQHGHVVVVVDEPLARGKYPTAYWGRLGGGGAEGKTINFAWRSADRDRVTYACIGPN